MSKRKPLGHKEKELTIRQKEKNLRNMTIMEAIGGGLITFFICAAGTAYKSVHPRAGLKDSLIGGLSETLSNPLFLFQHSIDWGITISAVSLVLLFIFMGYTYNKLRVHNDETTIAGKTQFADINDIVSRYAEQMDVHGLLEKLKARSNSTYKNVFNNVILSQNVYASIMAEHHFHALNTLVLGATGTGKTRYILKPNLLQMNASFVTVDPSGGAVAEVGEPLRRNGYKVQVINLTTFQDCDTYNPISYCTREADVKKLVEAFIRNTDRLGGKGGSKDPFWDDSMNLLLCSIVSLLAMVPEGENKPYAQMPEIMGDVIYAPTFTSVTEIVRIANKKWTPNCGISRYHGSRLGDGKNNTANASMLAAIFENIRCYEAQKQDCEPHEIRKPYCLREWEGFCLAPEKTSTTILMTTIVRLDAFNIDSVINLTSSDTLDLTHFGDEKTALFITIPASDGTYNFIASFLYTQLFDQIYHKCEDGTYHGTTNVYLPNGELIRHFNKAQVAMGEDKDFFRKLKTAKAKRVEVNGKLKKGINGKLKKRIDDCYYDIVAEDGTYITRRISKELADACIHDLKHAELKKEASSGFHAMPFPVRFLIDEFPSIGEIPDFKNILATVRKYHGSCMVICQTITQLKGMYPDDYEVIDANCPFLIFLGGDENSNNEYLSKKMGDATKRGVNYTVDNKRVSAGGNIQGGALMRPEDFGRLDFEDTILFIYGEQPIIDEKFDYPRHPMYRFTNDYAKDMGVADKAYCFTPTDSVGTYLTSLRTETPKAIPNVRPFSTDAFLRVMRRFSMEDAQSAMDENWENIENFGTVDM